MLVRARAEERVLVRDSAYAAYRDQTPDALVPGLTRLLRLARRGIEFCNPLARPLWIGRAIHPPPVNTQASQPITPGVHP